MGFKPKKSLGKQVQGKIKPIITEIKNDKPSLEY